MVAEPPAGPTAPPALGPPCGSASGRAICTDQLPSSATSSVATTSPSSSRAVIVPPGTAPFPVSSRVSSYTAPPALWLLLGSGGSGVLATGSAGSSGSGDGSSGSGPSASSLAGASSSPAAPPPAAASASSSAGPGPADCGSAACVPGLLGWFVGAAGGTGTEAGESDGAGICAGSSASSLESEGAAEEVLDGLLGAAVLGAGALAVGVGSAAGGGSGAVIAIATAVTTATVAAPPTDPAATFGSRSRFSVAFVPQSRKPAFTPHPPNSHQSAFGVSTTTGSSSAPMWSETAASSATTIGQWSQWSRCSCTWVRRRVVSRPVW